MHGIRRASRPSQGQLEQERKRSQQIANIIREALQLRKQPIPNPIDEAFEKAYNLVETALLTNPDEYTLWSFRRQVLKQRLEQQQPDEQKVKQLWQYELNLTTKSLHNHPKAYPAWQHRIWLLKDAPTDIPSLNISTSITNAINQELKLTEVLLTHDPRNFHGWAHRMRVRSILKSNHQHDDDDDKELSFVHNKILDDFANYSAWHHRSVLLPRIHNNNITQSLIDEEFDFVKQAFYTEPDVQSVWFYHRWLLAGAPTNNYKENKYQIKHDVLRKELVTCNELLELEPDATHAWQTKAHILSELGEWHQASEALDKLNQLDPMRKGYYDYLRRKLNSKH